LVSILNPDPVPVPVPAPFNMVSDAKTEPQRIIFIQQSLKLAFSREFARTGTGTAT
jgi:hypothetical protein